MKAEHNRFISIYLCHKCWSFFYDLTVDFSVHPCQKLSSWLFSTIIQHCPSSGLYLIILRLQLLPRSFQLQPVSVLVHLLNIAGHLLEIKSVPCHSSNLTSHQSHTLKVVHETNSGQCLNTGIRVWIPTVFLKRLNVIH